MKKLMMLCLCTLFVFAADGASLAKKLGLSAGSKASKQWERVFKKKSKKKRLGIDKLSQAEQNALKNYLISHAADAEQPTVAGM